MLGCGHIDNPIVARPEDANLAAEISQADALVQSALAAALGWANDPQVEGADYGLVGDGVADNTPALRKLFATGNRTIHIAAGDYVTGTLRMPGNTLVLFN